MKVTIESTDEWVSIGGKVEDCPTRVWRGKTEEGVEVVVLVACIGVVSDAVARDPGIVRGFREVSPLVMQW